MSGYLKNFIMRKNIVFVRKFSILSVIVLFIACSLHGQDYGKITNPSYRYVADPGFVNITELTGAIGLRRDTTGGIGLGDQAVNSKYYFGATNIFGYQIDRHFATGIGAGFYRYDNSSLVPLYLEITYIAYLKHIHPFFSADGGYMFDLAHFFDGSEIFINPGIGISKAFSPYLEGSLGAGLTVQMSSSMGGRSFLNFKIRFSFRTKPFRMFKEDSVKF